MNTRSVLFVGVLATTLLGETAVGTVDDGTPRGMALVPAGPFEMGDSFNENNDSMSFIEQPVHTVYVSAFYIDRYEVTKALWDEVYEWALDHGYEITGTDPFTWDLGNPGEGKGPNHPVFGVDWYQAQKWCNARSEKEGRIPAYYTSPQKQTPYRVGHVHVENGWVKWDAGYRLPTEAEWEKAARGGLKGKRFPWGDTITHNEANYMSEPFFQRKYDLNSTSGYHPKFNDGGWVLTSPVGSFKPNGYGLYDMAGNLWEWCWDVYDGSLYSAEPVIDPHGPDASFRTLCMMARGGSWGDEANYLRVAKRMFQSPRNGGFVSGLRCVLPTPSEWKRIIETPPPEPTYGECPEQLPGKDSLIIVTHGWKPDITWVERMTNAITSYLKDRGLDNWQVHAHKWVEKAQTPLRRILDEAEFEGNNLGKCLVKQKWSNVHFIGHSAGSALIQSASDAVKEHLPKIVTHLTFMDAYVGISYKGKGVYGRNADWSDHYFSRDASTALTGKLLDHAYNVDVTQVDPNKLSLGTYRSSWTGEVEECYQAVGSHEWPHEFYLRTIMELWPETEGLGFPLGKEGGGWNVATNKYAVGNSPARVLGKPDPSCVPDVSLPPPEPKTFLDFFKMFLFESPGGRREVNGRGLTLMTGSPVWISAAVLVTNAVNLVSLEAEFATGKTEGLLSIYWDTNRIGSVDGRVVSSGRKEYVFGLPGRETDGTHHLGFHLDPLSGTTSSVTVTNVALGFVGISEPFTLSVESTDRNGTPTLRLTGQPGLYTAEASTNLLDWTPFAVLINTNGTVTFVDRQRGGNSIRFYRAVAAP